MKKTIPLITIGLLAVMMGCAGRQTATGDGLSIVNELSTDRMQPGGTVILMTSISNYWDNELTNVTTKLTKSYGSRLTIDPSGVYYGVNTIQANPNFPGRAQWSLGISEQAINGETFENVVRVCFDYTQSAWHEMALVNSFDVESIPASDGDTGPLNITFLGLDNPYIYNEQIKSDVQLSISIKDEYGAAHEGYIGTINMPKGSVANITSIALRIYDGGGNYDLIDPDNASPGANFRVLNTSNSPSSLVCNNEQWDAENEYFECYVNDLPVFGETYVGTRLDIINLEEEELLEKVEIIVNYSYCVESEEFVLEVFQPGG